MEAVRKLYAEIVLIDKASPSIKNISDNLTITKSSISDLGSSITRTFAGLFASYKAFEAVTKSVKLAADFEELNVQYEVLLGSAEKATQLLKELKTWSDATPFTMQEANISAKALLSAGESAENLTKQLTMIGTVAKTSGVPLNELALIVAKNKTSMIVQGEDLNQFLGRGINLFAPLMKVLGAKSVIEVKDMVSKSKVTYEHLMKAMQIIADKNGSLLEKMSKTANGLWSTLKGNVEGLMIVFGGMILNLLKPILNIAINITSSLNKFAETEHGLAILKTTLTTLSVVIGVLLFKSLSSVIPIFTKFIMLNIILIANWLLLISVIALVVLAVQDFLTWMEGGQSVIGDFLGPFETFTKVFDDFFNWISSDKAIIKTLEEIFNFDKYFPGVVAFFKKVDSGFQSFERFIMSIPSKIRSGFNAAIDFITEKFTEFINWFPAQLSDMIGNIPNKLKNMLPEGVLNLAAKVGLIEKPSELPIEKTNIIENKSKQLPIENTGIIEKITELPIEQRAEGGPVYSGKKYLVGENGPELFSPSANGTIIPNGSNKSISIQSIIGSMTFNVTNSKEAVEDIQMAVLNALNKLSDDVLRAQSGMAL